MHISYMMARKVSRLGFNSNDSSAAIQDYSRTSQNGHSENLSGHTPYSGQIITD